MKEQNFKNRVIGVILTTISGSLGSFLLALFFLYAITYTPFYLFPKYIIVTLIEVFKTIIEMAIFFGILDLIPLPPFDGGRLLEFILPKSLHYIIDWLEEYSIYVLFALFFLPGINNIFFKFIYILSYFIKTILLFLVF